jgi:hypothetical protein
MKTGRPDHGPDSIEPCCSRWRWLYSFDDACRSSAQKVESDCSLEVSQFHVADAATILRVDPIALLYVATVLAQRLDSANRGLLELKRQVQAGEPRGVIGRTVEKIEGLLGATGANLMYAGYPYDPFAPDAPRS